MKMPGNSRVWQRYERIPRIRPSGWAAGGGGREAEVPVLELRRPSSLLTPRFIRYSHICNNMKSDKSLPLVTCYLRLALGASFRSAVADRFGIWGHNDARLVAWGDWSRLNEKHSAT
jgi:hypothetical protein